MSPLFLNIFYGFWFTALSSALPANDTKSGQSQGKLGGAAQDKNKTTRAYCQAEAPETQSQMLQT